MLHLKPWWGIFVLAMALLSFIACDRPAPSLLETKGGGGEFRALLPAEPVDLDPNSSRDEVSLLLAPNLYSRLVMLDADARLHPDLAERWEVSPDGRRYTFHLRRGVSWHDGRPFQAADVRWTLEHLAGRPTFSAEAIRRITRVETPDEHTVIVHLSEPWAPFLSTLADLGIFILPRPTKKPGRQVVVGTGPFQLAEWIPGRRIVLTANRSFFRPGPFLDRVVYTFESNPGRGPELVASGKVDYVVLRPSLSLLPRLAREERLRVSTSPSDGRYYLAFNLRRKPFDDPRVREAVNRAIDRPALLERALHGYGAPGYGFYTPAVAWAYDPNAQAPELDRARARALLDAAGLRPDPRDPEGIRLKTVLLCPTLGPFQDIAREVADQLREVGIAAHVETMSARQWMERAIQRHDFDLSMIGGGHGPDPENLNVRFGSRGTGQIMGYANPELDAALAEGARAVDLTRRARAYFRVQEILAHDLPIAPLAESVHVTLCRREVTGLARMEARGLVPEGEFSLVRVRPPSRGGDHPGGNR
jgi:peptide/nickel transport system substrate-binding protein